MYSMEPLFDLPKGSVQLATNMYTMESFMPELAVSPCPPLSPPPAPLRARLTLPPPLPSGVVCERRLCRRRRQPSRPAGGAPASHHPGGAGADRPGRRPAPLREDRPGERSGGKSVKTGGQVVIVGYPVTVKVCSGRKNGGERRRVTAKRKEVTEKRSNRLWLR